MLKNLMTMSGTTSVIFPPIFSISIFFVAKKSHYNVLLSTTILCKSKGYQLQKHLNLSLSLCITIKLSCQATYTVRYGNQ